MQEHDRWPIGTPDPIDRACTRRRWFDARSNGRLIRSLPTWAMCCLPLRIEGTTSPKDPGYGGMNSSFRESMLVAQLAPLRSCKRGRVPVLSPCVGPASLMETGRTSPALLWSSARCVWVRRYPRPLLRSASVPEATPPISPGGSPRVTGYRMPPETAPHERTLISWPCRRELWGSALDDAKREYAAVADAVAAFEPVTMVASTAADREEACRATSERVEVIEIPLDDSWVRDNGPTFVIRGARRATSGVHFGFNAWGAKFEGWDRDQAAGAALAGRFAACRGRGPVRAGRWLHLRRRARTAR